jgi:uncharacterized protein (DUF2267 family)
MTRDEFLKAVERRTGLTAEQAEDLTRATLTVLSGRLTAGEADDVASQLPAGLREAMLPMTPDAEPFDVDEFLGRVCELADIPMETASNGVRVVMTTLREAISAGEFDDMVAQLPEEYSQLVDWSVAPTGP